MNTNDSVAEKAIDLAGKDKKINEAVSKAIIIVALGLPILAATVGIGIGLYSGYYFWNKIYEPKVNSANSN